MRIGKPCRVAPARKSAIPSWVIFYILVLGGLGLCTAVIICAYNNWSAATSRHRAQTLNVEVLGKANTELQEEIDRFRSDPRVIEAAARERLGLVKPNEVIRPVESPLHTQKAVLPTAPAIPIGYKRLLVYLVLVLYCGGAMIGGFITVKCIMALGQFATGVPSSNAQTETSQAAYKRHRLLPASTTLSLIWLLVFGLILGGGFMFAASKQMDAVFVDQRREALRIEMETLREAQRRLLLAREAELSPMRLEKRARALGMVRPTVGQIDSAAVSVAESRPSSADSTGNISVSAPTISATILIVLALFGGAVGFMFSSGPRFSELMSEVRLDWSTIGRAPGARYLLLVDFLYSRKDVEHIFKPIVADWRTEYFEALSQNRLLKARWISVRYCYSFILAMGLSKMLSFVRGMTRIGG